MSSRPTVISLFCGIGGSSLGYRVAGYRELLAVDLDEKVLAVFRDNFPRVRVLKMDLSAATGKDLLEAAGAGSLDVLDGSPPCQGFSLGGKRQIMDRRNDLVPSFIRILGEIRPRAFLMENVPGMTIGRYRGLFNEYLRAMKAAGYRVAVEMANAAMHRVPQVRRRVLFLGIREDLGVQPSFPAGRREFVTFGQAVRGLEPGKTFRLTRKMTENWPHLQAGRVKSHGRGFGMLPTSMYMGMSKPRMDAPTSTLTASWVNVMVHPTERRSLGVEEMRAVCGFPPGFRLGDDWYLAKHGLGNSVPPPLIEDVARHLAGLLRRAA